MPVRTFDSLDIIDRVNIPNDASSSPTLFTDTDFGRVVAFNTDVTAATQFAQFSYIQSGTIDFTIFPAIPDGATISRVVITAPSSAGVTLSGDGAVGFAELDDVSPNNGDISFPEVSFAPGASINHTFSVPGVTAIDFDPAISKATLISTYGTQILGLSFNGTVNTTGNDAIVATVSLTGWTMEVTYNDPPATFTFNVATPTDPLPGSGEVVITSDPEDENPLPMKNITEIHLDWNDGTDHEIILFPWNFILWYPNELIFWIPFGFGEFTGPVEISAILADATLIVDGVPTEFSGSVPLGTIEILFEDASGIYRLVRGKKTDTLYNPDRSGETLDVKIPNPFARTGFIGG